MVGSDAGEGKEEGMINEQCARDKVEGVTRRERGGPLISPNSCNEVSDSVHSI